MYDITSISDEEISVKTIKFDITDMVKSDSLICWFYLMLSVKV